MNNTTVVPFSSRPSCGCQGPADKGLTLVGKSCRDETVGVLAAFDRADGEGGFSADEERLLEAFAASAATAVVTAQRVAASTLRRRVEAAEHERARWARELHDESLQDLAGLKILLASGRRGAAGRAPRRAPSTRRSAACRRASRACAR